MVCEWCAEQLLVDAHEYQQIKKYLLDSHGVTIPADRTQILPDCAETFGTKAVEKGKGVGKGSLHNWAKLTPG